MTIADKYANRSTFRVAEVAEILCCTPRHVLGLISAGRLVAVNIGAVKTLWRVEAGDLIRFLKSTGNGSRS